MTTLSHPLRTLAIGITLAVATIGCGDDLPSESDLPSEADLAYPGAVEIKRSFDDGETGTYIDGGSADRAPRLNLTYQLNEDGVSNQDIIDWYSGELASLGWVVDLEDAMSVSLEKDSDSDLRFGFGVFARVERSGEYDVVVAVSRDE